MGRLFFDFVLKEWLEVRIDFANAHIPCLIVLNQLEVDAAEGQNTDNVQHCRYCAEKVGDLPDKAGRKAIIFENYQSMWNEFNDLTNNQRGKLMIGIDFTRSRTLMPQVISAFNAEYPNIEVRLTEGTNREIIRALSNREIDIGIGRFGEAVQGLELLPYYREEVLLLVPPQVKNCGPLRKIHFLKDLSDFKNFPFVLGSESNKVGQIARTLLSEVPYTPIIKAQSNNIDTLLELCARGVGVCFAPKSAVKSILTEEQLGTMTVYQVGEDSSYPIKFAYRKTSYQWKIIDEFIRIAVDDLKRTLPLNYTY